MKKFLITLAILFVLGVASIIALVAYLSRDIPELDLSDLAVTQSVKPENTAYAFFMSASDALYLPINSNIVEDYINDEPVNLRLIAEVISKNEKTIELINRGIECESCITPEIVKFDDSYSYLKSWKKISRVLVAKAKSQRLLGDYKDATDTCITLIKFGNLIQKDAGSILDYLVGVSTIGLTLEQIRDLACIDTPREELVRLSKAIEGIDSSATGLIRAFKYECKIMNREVDDIRDGKSDELEEIPLFLQKHIPRFFLQPNRTKLITASLYRTHIKNATLHYTDMNLDCFEDIYPNNGNVILAMIKPNSLGKMLVYILMPPLDKVITLKCRLASDIIAMRLIVNMWIYKKDNGAFPKSLQDLVPQYIDAVPTDPFDGKPFRYKPDKGIIYSVGIDCIDSGGSTVKLPEYERKSGKPNPWHLEDAVYEIEKKQDEVTTPSVQEGRRET